MQFFDRNYKLIFKYKYFCYITFLTALGLLKETSSRAFLQEKAMAILTILYSHLGVVITIKSK